MGIVFVMGGLGEIIVRLKVSIFCLSENSKQNPFSRRGGLMSLARDLYEYIFGGSSPRLLN